jgi:hypothetical protein
MVRKISHKIFPLKYGFGISYDISRKYMPMWVSVLVSDLNQNSSFSHTLFSYFMHTYGSQRYQVF